MRALVAMSGGVDSSVAAALLVEAGHDVIGVTLKQWEDADGRLPTAGCCTVGDAEDARRVAAQLDVPYYVLDYVDEFRTSVVDRFGADYLAGRTPNPCIECNRTVRFRALLERASQLDCEVLATGHHARVDWHRGRYRLRRAVDAGKDQSYVLHMLGQPELGRLRFPVGEMTKDEVRRRAAELGLRTAGKPDSQDICFVGRGDYREFLREHFPASAAPGVVVDTDGNQLARHDGTAGFTIGQRRGLGIGGHEARYVVAIDAPTATVVVAERDRLLSRGCLLAGVSFTGSGPPATEQVDVQLRYRSAAVAARLRPSGAGWEVAFDDPQRAVAPGQSAVFYRGDEVLGGGTIAEVLPWR